MADLFDWGGPYGTDQYAAALMQLLTNKQQQPMQASPFNSHAVGYPTIVPSDASGGGQADVINAAAEQIKKHTSGGSGGSGSGIGDSPIGKAYSYVSGLFSDAQPAPVGDDYKKYQSPVMDRYLGRDTWPTNNQGAPVQSEKYNYLQPPSRTTPPADRPGPSAEKAPQTAFEPSGQTMSSQMPEVKPQQPTAPTGESQLAGPTSQVTPMSSVRKKNTFGGDDSGGSTFNSLLSMAFGGAGGAGGILSNTITGAASGLLSGVAPGLSGMLGSMSGPASMSAAGASGGALSMGM